MKKSFLLRATSIALLPICLNSCATIISGTQQSIDVRSQPSGAQVTVDNKAVGRTPTVVELERRTAHTIVVDLDGYRPQEFTLKPGFNAWVLGNVIIGGVLGIVIDMASGAMYSLSPGEIDASFGAGTAAKMESNGTLVIATVLKADPSWNRIGQFQKLP